MGKSSSPSSRPFAVVPRVSPFLLVVLASAAAWAVLFAAVPPARQNFPLIDDWAFGRGAFLFARGEGIHYSNWGSMPQLGQWLWACPFVWLLGESFFALRLSTIVLSWIGLWAFDDLLRQEGIAPARAALATAVLAFNPLFFLLQGTFMTDVPSLSLALAALALYARALRRKGTGWLAGACLAAMLAVATRQNTAALSIVVAILLWREKDLRIRPLWWVFALAPAVVGVAIHLWFQGRPDIIAVEPRVLPPYNMLQLPFVVLHWAGLTTLPLLILQPRVGSRGAFAILFVLLAAWAGYWLYQGLSLDDLDGFFPYTDSGSLLSIWGVDSGERMGERPIVLGWSVRWLLTLLGCVGGAMFLLRAAEWRRRRLQLSPVMLFSVCQLPFILVAPALWDRYLLPLVLPGALAVTVAGLPVREEDSARLRLASCALVAVLGMASVGLMHDWLAWNAASWELGRRAISRHIDPLAIEGGMEWDGSSSAFRQRPERRLWREIMGFAMINRKAGGPKGLTLATTRVWFPRVTGRYALSFSELRGARRVDAEPYSLWLLPGQRQFFLLESPPLAAAPAGSRDRGRVP